MTCRSLLFGIKRQTHADFLRAFSSHQSAPALLYYLVIAAACIALLKWGKPCFTFMKKNVAIVIPLKESCAFSFFKGALLKDPKHILERIGEHTQAGGWIKLT